MSESETSPPALPDWHRLHWSSLIFHVLSHARGILLPGIVVLLFASGRSRWEMWVMILFPIVMGFELIRYISVRYQMSGNELVVKRGIFWRNVRNIPCERIQNLDLVQNPLHRALGVAEVRIETASGSEPEAILKVLSLGAVERLRASIFTSARAAGAPRLAEHGSDADPPRDHDTATVDEGVVILRVPRGELIRLGFISNRGLALIAVILGVGFQFDLIEPERIYRRVESWFQSIDLAGAAVSDVTLAAIVALMILAAMALYFFTSIAMTIMRLDGFTLRRVGDDLRITCGLFTRLTATVPRRRVQLVTVQQSSLHRMLGRVTVRVETAGGAGKDGKETAGRQWFIPIARPEEVPALLRAAGLDLGFDSASWIPPAPGARGRMVKRKLLMVAPLSLIGLTISAPWGAVGLACVLIPLAIWRAYAEARYMAHAHVPGGVLYRSGVLVRRMSGVRHERVQTVSVSHSPFDRRHDMATLHLDTAGAGPIGHRVRIPYMRSAQADHLAQDVALQAEGGGFVW